MYQCSEGRREGEREGEEGRDGGEEPSITRILQKSRKTGTSSFLFSLPVGFLFSSKNNNLSIDAHLPFNPNPMPGIPPNEHDC